MRMIKQVTRADVLAALAEVESKCGAETSNMLRAVFDSLTFIVETETDAPTIASAPAVDHWYAGR